MFVRWSSFSCTWGDMERKQDAFSSLYLWSYTTEVVSKFRFREWIYTSNEINRLYIFSLQYHQQIRYSTKCLISSHTNALNEKEQNPAEATLEKQPFCGAAAVVAVARQAGTCPAEARVDTASWVVGSNKYNIQKYKIKQTSTQPATTTLYSTFYDSDSETVLSFQDLVQAPSTGYFFQAKYGSPFNLRAQFSSNFLSLIWCPELP